MTVQLHQPYLLPRHHLHIPTLPPQMLTYLLNIMVPTAAMMECFHQNHCNHQDQEVWKVDLILVRSKVEYFTKNGYGGGFTYFPAQMHHHSHVYFISNQKIYKVCKWCILHKFSPTIRICLDPTLVIVPYNNFPWNWTLNKQTTWQLKIFFYIVRTATCNNAHYTFR